MKRSITLLTLILLTLISKAQTSIAPDTINVNTTWQDTVYLDTNVYIQNGVILTVSPGTKVIANGDYKIEVQGCLQAIGTEQDSILFTVNDTIGFADLAVTYGGWGGIELLNTDENNDSTIFDYCIMQFGKANGVNSDERIGGILNVNNFNKIRISNSVIQNNFAGVGAGFNFKESTAKIEYCIFNNNHATGGGGALSFQLNTVSFINHNIFINNKAGYRDPMPPYLYQESGAAIYLSSDDENYVPIIINNKFFNNECTMGNAIYESTRKIIFINNIIANSIGTVIMCGHTLCNSVYYNNTIINNDTYDIMSVVDIMGSASFINNIIVGYTDDSHFSQPLLTKSMGVITVFNNIKYNYFQYGNDYLAGEGNIVGGDPSLMFEDPSTFVGFDEDAETYSYVLKNTAECVNAGIIDTTGLNLPDYDIAGLERIFGGRIDMGAHENKTVVWDNVKEVVTNNTINIFPNPAHNQITISSEQLVFNNIEILDIMGRSINYQGLEPIDDFTLTIDISTLKTGVYFIKVNDKIAKFVKE